MSRYAPKKPRGRGDPGATQAFTISAADVLNALPPPPSVTPAAAPQVVTVDYATTDQRRIYRETVPVPVPIPTASSSSNDAGTAPSVDDPPLSIPNWAPFFRDDGMDNAEDNTAEPSAQEHARRYVNSVSPQFTLSFREPNVSIRTPR